MNYWDIIAYIFMGVAVVFGLVTLYAIIRVSFATRKANKILKKHPTKWTAEERQFVRDFIDGKF